jgi:hypothetical protein
MIRRLSFVTAWLLVGSGIVAGLFWAFLNTPESNTLMLVLSAVLVVLMVVLSGLVITAAVLLGRGDALLPSIMTGARRIAWVMLIAIPVVLMTWAILRGDRWVAEKSGEISAWFIARFGWSDVSALFRAENYLSNWLRWVFLPITALTALASVLAGGSLSPRAWLRTAWHWRTLLIATLSYVVFIFLPWQAAFLRQDNLPATWVQPTLAGFRLGFIGVLMALGLAIMVITVARGTERTTANVAE